MVSTQDSESCDPSSNLGGTCVYLFSSDRKYMFCVWSSTQIRISIVLFPENLTCHVFCPLYEDITVCTDCSQLQGFILTLWGDKVIPSLRIGAWLPFPWTENKIQYFINLSWPLTICSVKGKCEMLSNSRKIIWSRVSAIASLAVIALCHWVSFVLKL